MKYCGYCGAEVMDEAVVCPKCGCDLKRSDTLASHKYCRHCGGELPPYSLICPKCGYPVELTKREPETKTAEQAPAPRVSKQAMGYGITSIILGVLSIFPYAAPLSVFGIFMGIVGLRKSGKVKRDRRLNIAGLVISCIFLVISTLTSLFWRDILRFAFK